jgi:hypothetical protein
VTLCRSRIALMLDRALCDSATVLRCFGATVLRCHGALVLRCHGALVLRCHGASVLQCFTASVLRAQLPKEHFRQSHSFGLNTAMSLIHYPRLSETERTEMNTMDIRAGGEDAERHEAERGRVVQHADADGCPQSIKTGGQ